MSVDYSMIGKRIKQKRKQLHQTQDYLAEALGVSVGYVSQIERGVTKISLDTLSAISSFLQCDITELDVYKRQHHIGAIWAGPKQHRVHIRMRLHPTGKGGERLRKCKHPSIR